MNLHSADTLISDSDRFWSLVGRYYDPATEQCLAMEATPLGQSGACVVGGDALIWVVLDA